MAVDIINPTYWITELLGSLLLFALLLLLGVLYFASKKRLNFQWTISLVVLTFLLLPLVFESFRTWIPVVIILIGLLVGFIYYRYYERT